MIPLKLKQKEYASLDSLAKPELESAKTAPGGHWRTKVLNLNKKQKSIRKLKWMQLPVSSDEQNIGDKDLCRIRMDVHRVLLLGLLSGEHRLTGRNLLNAQEQNSQNLEEDLGQI